MSTNEQKHPPLLSRLERSAKIAQTALVFLPVYFILFLILGFIVASYLKSLGVLIFIALVGPVVTHIYFGNKRLDRFEQAHIQLREAVLNVPHNVDYYTAGWAQSISLDLSNNRFHVARFFSSKNPPEVLELNFDKIINVSARQPGYSVVVGNTTLADKADNIKSEDESIRETGLYIDYDDLVNYRVFVQMPFPTAERWVRAFEKLKAGTLEPQTSAVCLHSL